MELLLVFFIFVAMVLLIEGAFLLARSWWNPETKRVQAQLRQLSAGAYGQEGVDLVRRRLMSDIPWFNRFLLSVRLPVVDRIDRMLVQANLPYPLGVVLLAMLVFFVGGYAAVSLLSPWFVVALAAGLVLGPLPLLYVYMKKQKRLKRFEEKLPEALEMLARSLKAGHAFTGGLQMVGQEFGDPIGTEFSKTLDEINFGVSYEDALRNLASRIDSEDIKLFVISVIIQRTSGGNLAEILDNLGNLIRERFKLKAHVRAVSAEGRISAYILIALPFAIGFTIYLLNPGYLNILFTDPAGHFMIVAMGIMMIIGALVMKRMVNFKV